MHLLSAGPKNTLTLRLTLSSHLPILIALDDPTVVEVIFEGNTFAVVGGTFTANAPVAVGAQSLDLTATDSAGNIGRRTLLITQN